MSNEVAHLSRETIDLAKREKNQLVLKKWNKIKIIIVGLVYQMEYWNYIIIIILLGKCGG